MFNTILPKFCEIFAKSFSNFKKNLIQQLIQWCINNNNNLFESHVLYTNVTCHIFNQYTSVNIGRMIYFRENSNYRSSVPGSPSSRTRFDSAAKMTQNIV